MRNVFLILGSKMRSEIDSFDQNFSQRISNFQKLQGDKEEFSCFECNSDDTYKTSISEIKKIAEENPNDPVHLIVYAHGQMERQLDLGNKILPEKIFDDLSCSDQKVVISVFSCYSGAGLKAKSQSEDLVGSEKLPHLGELETMIVYGGKRVTISDSNIYRLINLIESQDFIPQLLVVKDNGFVELMPPETVKIVEQGKIEEFSAFSAFKEGRKPSKQEIVQDVINKQKKVLVVLLGEEKAKEKTDRLDKLSGSLADESEEVLAESNVGDYLREMALLVVMTKPIEKVNYFYHLISPVSEGGLGIDPMGEFRPYGRDSFMILEACNAGNHEVVKYLLERDKKVIDLENDKGVTPLMACCRGGNVETLKELLHYIEKKHVTQISKSGYSSLHYAAESGNDVVFSVLAENFNDPAIIEQESTYGQSSIDIALNFNRWQIVEFLLNKGCQTNKSDWSLKTSRPEKGNYPKIDEMFEKISSSAKPGDPSKPSGLRALVARRAKGEGNNQK